MKNKVDNRVQKVVRLSKNTVGEWCFEAKIFFLEKMSRVGEWL